MGRTGNETGAASPGASAASRHAARTVFATFVLTFAAARLLVFLIMTRAVPDLFLYVGGTHVHHLNFGIVMLSVAGAWLLWRRPAGRELTVATLLYGVGLALTFDEFGMWLHLGGSYWQRASYDAVVLVAALLGLAAFAPGLRRFRARHWAVLILVLAAVAAFVAGLVLSLR
jgi:hypothetical protein